MPTRREFDVLLRRVGVGRVSHGSAGPSGQRICAVGGWQSTAEAEHGYRSARAGRALAPFEHADRAAPYVAH